MAVFDPISGKGSVCYLLKYPPTTEGWFLVVDAPGIYRKVALYTLVDKIVPTGFDGTYQCQRASSPQPKKTGSSRRFNARPS